MSSFKGTPGKWDVGIDGEILSDAGYIVMGTDLVHGNDSDLELIAAAPELLEALQEVVKAIRQYEMDVGESAPYKHRMMMEKAELALSKALGQ